MAPSPSEKTATSKHIYMYWIINGNCPHPFMEKFTYFSGGSHDGKYCNLCTHKSKSQEEFFYFAAKAWNILPQTLRASESSKSFSSAYKNALMEKVIEDEHYQTNNSYVEFYLFYSTNPSNYNWLTKFLLFTFLSSKEIGLIWMQTCFPWKKLSIYHFVCFCTSLDVVITHHFTVCWAKARVCSDPKSLHC